jgi:prepilin-type N-terminal cleavage/methylation domain-containing protein
VKISSRHSAFTLIEMLVVIAIIGILAAVSLPTISGWGKGNVMLASTRQMLDDVQRARQYAISQRTTVYMVFCPESFWNDPLRVAGPDRYAVLPATETVKGEKLYGKQLNSYNFVTLRTVGEQPGKVSPRYLSSWKTLPEGATIAAWKFGPRTTSLDFTNPPGSMLSSDVFTVRGFARTNTIPFPSSDAALTTGPYVTLPYIAFNHLGQPESGEDEFIPLAKGSVNYERDANKVPTQAAPRVAENPPGNSSNAFTIVRIDKLTGRARLEKQEFK